ncbi:MAG TPA: hypothetical protein VL335_03445 [Candidatus Paceibacterota bacterium]|jgi:hypothetical protein|nr:hypothetical protein [Candidatus Paceibacterota bacterium]
MARLYIPESAPKPRVVRVLIHENGEFSIPLSAKPGDIIVDQSGVYVQRMKTRQELVACN